MPQWGGPPVPPGSPPGGPGWGPPPASSGGGSGKTLAILALIAVPVLLIVGLVVMSGDDDDGGSTSTGFSSEQGDDDTASGTPEDAQDSDSDDDESDVPDTMPTIPPTTVAPAEADVNDCISVDTAGTLDGVGSCSDGGTPYQVTEVLDYSGICSGIDDDYIYSGDYTLCLQVNLVETYCYVIPDSGWITVADACEAPGTSHVIDVVPGADDDSYCTNEYEWNYWYAFESPLQVVCVMKY